MTRKWKYIFEADEIHKFNRCPDCGKEWLTVYDGDYHGMLQCLNCDFEIDFEIKWEDSE